MDLTIPYTFYPIALPHSIAWALFVAAMLGGMGVGVVRARSRGAASGLMAGVLAATALLVATMLGSMVITFFVHDV
jgi:hypothetical protein